jgi:hypothetical protein
VPTAFVSSDRLISTQALLRFRGERCNPLNRVPDLSVPCVRNSGTTYCQNQLDWAVMVGMLTVNSTNGGGPLDDQFLLVYGCHSLEAV